MDLDYRSWHWDKEIPIFHIYLERLHDPVDNYSRELFGVC